MCAAKMASFRVRNRVVYRAFWAFEWVPGGFSFRDKSCETKGLRMLVRKHSSKPSERTPLVPKLQLGNPRLPANRHESLGSQAGAWEPGCGNRRVRRMLMLVQTPAKSSARLTLTTGPIPHRVPRLVRRRLARRSDGNRQSRRHDGGGEKAGGRLAGEPVSGCRGEEPLGQRPSAVPNAMAVCAYCDRSVARSSAHDLDAPAR